jgi:hypothetical protein
MVFTTNSRPVFVSMSMLSPRSSQPKVINKLRESLTLKRFGAPIRNKLSAFEVQQLPSSTTVAIRLIQSFFQHAGSDSEVPRAPRCCGDTVSQVDRCSIVTIDDLLKIPLLPD